MEKDKNKPTKPDDSSNVLVEDHIKIFNPETKEEYVNRRD